MNSKNITKVVFSAFMLIYLGISGIHGHANDKTEAQNYSHQKQLNKS